LTGSRSRIRFRNEIRELGAKNSNKRSPQQTEDARFWLLTGPLSTHPLSRQIAIRREMSIIDSARFMTVITAAEADAAIAVMDAKYNYAFWRPITAIRNGDIDGNDATEREATWQPIDNTPMHPEYPCAHCIISSAVASAIEAMLGTSDIPEVAMTSPTAPGVTHRWTSCCEKPGTVNGLIRPKRCSFTVCRWRNLARWRTAGDNCRSRILMTAAAAGS
jgi:hypothetical protein